MMSDPTATAALRPSSPVADPQWRGARVVGHVRLATHEMRWIVELTDGTQRRVVAVEVQDDWETPMPMKRCESCKTDVPINDWDYGVCGRCRRLAGAE